MPAKFIIHAFGPDGNNISDLESVFQSIFSYFNGEDIRSLAISTFYVENNTFSLARATSYVLQFTREFLENEENISKVDRIVFVSSLPQNYQVFLQLFSFYFPLEDSESFGEEEEIIENFSSEEFESEEYESEENQFESIIEGKNDGSEPEMQFSNEIGSFSPQIVATIKPPSS